MSLRGAIERIPLEAVLQLLAETGRTGHLEVRGDGRSGTLGLSGGRLVSAHSDGETGESALGELFTGDHGTFEFTPADRVDGGDLSGDLDEILDRAVAERDRIAAIHEVIPDERASFTLSPRAAESAQIRMSPDQWRVLLAVDGTRDVTAIAQHLGAKRLAVLDLLAGLVREGMVDGQGAAAPGDEARASFAAVEHTAGGEAVALAGRTGEFPLEAIVPLLAATKQTGRVEVQSGFGVATLGLDSGRLVSASADDETGDLALGAIFALGGDAEFRFVPAETAPAMDLTGDLEELLARAAETRDRIAAIRSLVPNDRVRFALSERATQHGEITLTPAEWKALLAVKSQPDLAGISSQLGLRRLPTMVILADLIESGLVDVTEAPPEPSFETMPVEEPAAEAPAEAAPITEVPPPPATWDEPPAVEPAAPETPAWEAPAAEAAPSEAAPSWEAPSMEPVAAEPQPEAQPEPQAEPEPIDPRLAAFGLGGPAAPVETPPAAPEPYVDPRLAWTTPAPEAPAEAPAPAEPEATDLVVDLAAGTTTVEAPAPEPPAPPAEVAAPSAPAQKKGMFGGLFGAKQAAPDAPPPAASQARTRAGQLALFVNELLAAYNSGQYGKGRVEDRMASLLMRTDEHADPVDRPLPVKHDRLDVGAVDGTSLPERQSLPYLATLARQVYDDAERALGRDKAKRGFRDTRDRLFGRDLALFQAPEIAQRFPRV